MNNMLVNATKWSMATQIASKLISPFVNMVLARLLNPEAFGAVATISMVISFAEIFTDAGFQKYIVQHEFVDDKAFDESVNVAFWSNFMLSFLFVVLICFFRNQIAALVGSEDLGVGIAVASFSILCVAFSSIQSAVCKRNFDFKLLFFVRIITSLIPLFVTVPLALVFRNYWALIIGTIFLNIAQAVILTIKSPWKPRKYYSYSKFKEMFSFTAWTLMETIAIWLTSYVGTFIVGRQLNAHYLGLYKTSMTTVNSCMAIVTAGITPVLFSALSREQNHEKRYQEIYFSFQKWVAVLMMPLGIGLYIYRELIVYILLGNDWHEASDFVGMWGLASAFSMVLNNFTSEVCRSKGRPDISLLGQIIQLTFLIPTIIISVNYGFEVLCISRTAMCLFNIVIALIIVNLFFKISVVQIIKNILPSLIAACVMGASALFMKELVSGIGWEFVTIAISGIVYFAVLMLFPQEKSVIMKKINQFCSNR